MKGIVIVSETEFKDRHDVIKHLEKNCEQVIKKDHHYHFHSKNGVLMNMICTLLDHEIQYTLNFTNDKILQK